jgi:hypothetical protein
MRSKLFFALLLLIGFGAPATACEFGSGGAAFGVDLHMEVYVESGKVCASALSLSGAIKSYTITQPPKHGRAMTKGYIWAYQSLPGFKGKDDFVVTLVSEATGGTQTSLTRVSVNVR